MMHKKCWVFANGADKVAKVWKSVSVTEYEIKRKLTFYLPILNIFLAKASSHLSILSFFLWETTRKLWEKKSNNCKFSRYLVSLTLQLAIVSLFLTILRRKKKSQFTLNDWQAEKVWLNKRHPSSLLLSQSDSKDTIFV